jgi:hypothetical protein
MSYPDLCSALVDTEHCSNLEEKLMLKMEALYEVALAELDAATT